MELYWNLQRFETTSRVVSISFAQIGSADGTAPKSRQKTSSCIAETQLHLCRLDSLDFGRNFENKKRTKQSKKTTWISEFLLRFGHNNNNDDEKKFWLVQDN